jgi:DNA-binding NarL/FixJ family response regulator
VEKTRVLIVDDHPSVRRGIASYLDAAPYLEVVGEAAEAAQLEPAIREHRPDLLLLDLRLGPSFDPLTTVRWLQRSYPQLQVVILSAYDEARWVKLMLEAGVPGFIHKAEPPAVLLQGIRAVLAGEQWFSYRLLRAFAGEYGRDSALSPHEQLILQRIANGLLTREVASEMRLSERTIRGYVSGAIQKLGARSRAAAVAEAFRRGLIE